MKIVDHMLVLDVDGVISNLKEKKASQVILKHISDQLKKGMPVALNTGRSLTWVITRACKPLINNSQTKKVLRNLIIVGEKGGTWMTFDNNGNAQEHIDESISISSNLRKDIKNLIAAKYSKSMFYDTPKKTMISAEMKDGYNMNKYAQDQKLLNPQVKKIIKKHGLEKVLTIEPNPIALDIQNKHVGKHLGIKRILNWLRENKIKASSFTTIGDMPSDIKMAEKLHRNDFSVLHVHVGEKNINTNIEFPVKITENKFEKGTLEFLKTL